MNFNAWTRAGCSRLINEQMAGALWVAVPCVHISHVGVCSEQRTDCSARRSAQVILHIYTFPGKDGVERINSLRGENSSRGVIFCLVGWSEVAHSGSERAQTMTRPSAGKRGTKNITCEFVQ